MNSRSMEEGDREWFYEKNGQQQGPVSEEALKALVATGGVCRGVLT